MITEFDDFVAWMHLLIDDIWRRLARCTSEVALTCLMAVDPEIM